MWSYSVASPGRQRLLLSRTVAHGEGRSSIGRIRSSSSAVAATRRLLPHLHPSQNKSWRASTTTIVRHFSKETDDEDGLKNNKNDDSNNVGGGRRSPKHHPHRRPHTYSPRHSDKDPVSPLPSSAFSPSVKKRRSSNPNKNEWKEEVEAEMELVEADALSASMNPPASSSATARRTGSIAKNSPLDELNDEEYSQVKEFQAWYQNIMSSSSIESEKELYYWDEDQIDMLESQSRVRKQISLYDQLKEQAVQDEATGQWIVSDVPDEIFDQIDAPEEDGDNDAILSTTNATGDVEASDDTEVNTDAPTAVVAAPATAQPPQQQQSRERQFQDEEDPFEFAMEAMGGLNVSKPHPPDYDRVTPLKLAPKPCGTYEMYDLVEAMMHHPTKYGETRYKVAHPQSLREPLVDWNPSHRRQPSKDFVRGHVRFLYVWGLPTLVASSSSSTNDDASAKDTTSNHHRQGSVVDLDNPLETRKLQQQVGQLFDVPLEQVSMASDSSAFVGFTSVEDFRFASMVGPAETELHSSPVVTQHVGEDGQKAILLLNMPAGLSPATLAESLFPADTEVGKLYADQLTKDNIRMLSPTSAVLPLDESVLTSVLVQERLEEIGLHTIRYAKARREMVPSGKHEPIEGTPIRIRGPRLIVDGDMPTKDFFLSHEATLSLRHVDPQVSKQDVSTLFQPFCTFPRDIEGSVEMVMCGHGRPTGRVYVGFDEIQEAQMALAALAKDGRLHAGILGSSSVVMKKVKEVGTQETKPEHRSSRSEEELLGSLHNWESYVNPQDLEALLEAGINKKAIDEALRNIRFQNPTFAALDQAMRSETINPDKEVGGMYAELVQTYVSTLKDCISTPDDPGPIYESLFVPGEEIDTGVFDAEPERQESLNRKRRGL